MKNANTALIAQLNQGWPRRATVCDIERFRASGQFDAEKPDYPVALVPFYTHEAIERLDAPLKQAILTWGWIGYNRRTVAAEDHVVNPALNYLASEILAGDAWVFTESIRQTLVDEHYHTLMHLNAIQRTRRERKIELDMDLPMSVTYRELERLKRQLVEPWEKQLAGVVFATVAEISVNAFLDILADDETIQPLNRSVAQMHNRDEYAHSKTLGEISKVIFHRLTAKQKTFFVATLPVALRAFVAQDFSMWEAILRQLGVPNATEIVLDARQPGAQSALTRDYSGLYRLADELGILGELEFDFSDSTANKKPAALHAQAH
ncbi:para-aminobenzoate N-oxygenase AurF [Trinickia symbiotica]|uniref:Aminobenzoate oxygenase n=1 Tax=Trinickia symbiotica TaxID=863227 RepID=A0A2N7X131_9BURK|nr:diiron oxygenase [Trinickia symbiotica]PMS35453.1 aminobenzoate oxygenase [Trinickia symbiotica]PPK45479.1 para-aminobenzoate N-oxygenase AurF [Trinickia symbiotica]